MKAAALSAALGTALVALGRLARGVRILGGNEGGGNGALVAAARVLPAAAEGRAPPTAALGRAYDELSEMYYITDNSLWYIHPYEVRQQDGRLRFIQPGRGIGDICKRFNPDQASALLD